MLALTRKIGETLIINDNIEIYIAGIYKDQVRIGIKAPREVSIYRKEVYEKIQKQNREAILDVNIKDLKKMFDID